MSFMQYYPHFLILENNLFVSIVEANRFWNIEVLDQKKLSKARESFGLELPKNSKHIYP